MENSVTDNELIQKEYYYLIEDYKNSGHRLDFEIVDKAFNFANTAHQGVKRRSGEPYMLHPLAVARVVVREIGLGTTSVCAALLHDVVEDTDYTVEDIEDIFGKRIALIVDGLTKISGGVFGTHASSQAENFRKLLLSISNDVRVLMIKIADRLHNMRTLSSMPPAKQYKIAGETLYLYAPLAYRLGLFKIKTELENLSFKYEHPEIYNEINQKLIDGEEKREEVYTKFITPIEEKLREKGYEFQIEKRVKTPFSIWNKMQTKHISFEDVYDLLAVRIIFKAREDISEKEQCFMIYTAITSLYMPHPDRTRDWVSQPKANGYEALHCTVMIPAHGKDVGQWIEVQIRSERMHDIAEKGLSAHWKYKVGGEEAQENELDNWLKTIKEIIENPEPDALDFLDTFKLNLFSNEIFVFTPKGDIHTLPQGSTALDFAFSLHSDLGLHCIGAKANHKLIPISQPLSSGDQVEILTSHNRFPEPDWLSYVTTARAKSRLKEFFRKEKKSHLVIGQDMIEKKFAEMGIPLNKENFQLVLDHFKKKERIELALDVAEGRISLDNIEKTVFRQEKGTGWRNFWGLQFGFGKKQENEETPKVQIDRKKTIKLTDDESRIHYKVADCCNPIPGDDVLGYIDNDETIFLHKRQCPVAVQLNAKFGERIISAEWKSKKVMSFLASLEITGFDRQGLLLKILQVISQDYAVNIQKIDIEAKDGIFKGRINVYIHNTEDLNILCAKIAKIQDIKSIKRVED
jgi:GTP pyrophosphokinase